MGDVSYVVILVKKHTSRCIVCRFEFKKSR